MVFGYYRAMDIPVAFALAGSYIDLDLTQKGLVDLHRLTIEAAAKSAAIVLKDESQYQP